MISLLLFFQLTNSKHLETRKRDWDWLFPFTPFVSPEEIAYPNGLRKCSSFYNIYEWLILLELENLHHLFDKLQRGLILFQDSRNDDYQFSKEFLCIFTFLFRRTNSRFINIVGSFVSSREHDSSIIRARAKDWTGFTVIPVMHGSGSRNSRCIAWLASIKRKLSPVPR